MTIVQAKELALQLEELIYITMKGITGMRRENSINALAHALVDATKSMVVIEE